MRDGPLSVPFTILEKLIVLRLVHHYHFVKVLGDLDLQELCVIDHVGHEPVFKDFFLA